MPLILGCKRTDLLAAALVVVCVAVKGKGCSIIEKREFCIGVHDDDELADSRFCAAVAGAVGGRTPTPTPILSGRFRRPSRRRFQLLLSCLRAAAGVYPVLCATNVSASCAIRPASPICSSGV